MTSAFATEFARTLAAAPKEVDDNYEGTHGRPVTFAEMPVAPPRADLDAAEAPVKVSLKSIRAPKFQLEYTVPRTDTIFAVKERLLSDAAGPIHGAGHAPANIKLVLKAKVVADTRQLRELPSTEFTVMFVTATEPIDVPVPAQVYWGSPAGEAHRSAAPASEAAPAPRQKPGLTDSFWSEIEAVAQRYVDNPAALVAKLKAVAN